MVDAFDLDQKKWNFTATPSSLLSGTTLPIPASASTAHGGHMASLKPLHDGNWWAEQTKGMDFSVEDHLDTAKYNRLLWTGTMGDRAYPENRSGLDLRQNRAELLRKFHERQAAQTPSGVNEVTAPIEAAPAGASR